jgi:hypothetical protein
MVCMMDILSGAVPLIVDVRQSGSGPILLQDGVQALFAGARLEPLTSVARAAHSSSGGVISCDALADDLEGDGVAGLRVGGSPE